VPSTVMVRRQSLERIRIGQASSLSLSEDFTLFSRLGICRDMTCNRSCKEDASIADPERGRLSNWSLRQTAGLTELPGDASTSLPMGEMTRPESRGCGRCRSAIDGPASTPDERVSLRC
jgi:hypothetical protein